VIFVSADRSDADFTHYLETMPWHAVDEIGGELNDQLSELFGVDGIPTLVLLDNKGKLLTDSAVGLVAGDPDGNGFPWTPKPVNILMQTTASMISGPALIAFCQGDTQAKSLAQDLISSVSEWQAETGANRIEGADELSFFTAGTDPIVERVLSLMGPLNKDVKLAVLDLSSGQCVIADIAKNDAPVSVADVKTFALDYGQGKYRGKTTPLSPQ